MIGLLGARNESRERFAWQHFDLLTKGKHTVGCSYSRGDVTPSFRSDFFFPCALGLCKSQ